MKTSTENEILSANAAVVDRLRREHMVFEVDGLLYAIVLADFDAVAQASFQPQTVQDLPAWMGIIEHSESLVPVLALHPLLDTALPTRSSTKTIDHRLLLFGADELRCALHVHRCLGVFPIDTSRQLELARSALLRKQNSGCRSIVKWRGRLIVVLDPAQLISSKLATRLTEQLFASDAKKRLTKREKPDAKLRDPAAATGGRYQWSGALAGSALAQVIQVLWLKKLTGELKLESNGRAAVILWDKGQAIHARNGASVPPEDILRSTLRWREGRFDFRTCAVPPSPRMIQCRTQDILRDVVSTAATHPTKLTTA